MKPKMDKNNYPQQIRRLEAKIHRLKLLNEELSRECIQRGIEITRLIKIMFTCENVIPEEKMKQFVETALEYASRCDMDRDLMNRKTKLYFGEARPRYGNS